MTIGKHSSTSTTAGIGWPVASKMYFGNRDRPEYSIENTLRSATETLAWEPETVVSPPRTEFDLPGREPCGCMEQEFLKLVTCEFDSTPPPRRCIARIRHFVPPGL